MATIIFVICLIVIGVWGNGWVFGSLALGTIAIVYGCYVLLWPHVTPVGRRRHHLIRRIRHTPKSVRMKDCETCGGAGAMRLVGGKLVKIPRSEWEVATWRSANLQNCRTCNGLGRVADLSG